MRVGVLASGAGSNLQALLDHVHGVDGVRIVAVASDKPGAPALDRARAAGVPAEVFPRDAFADRPGRDAAIADWLRGHDVELVVLAGYMQLLGPAFLDRFPQRVINVHPALLPAFPGLDAIGQAISYGARLTGVTVHFVDGGVDTGPVILQEAVIVQDDDDRSSLAARIHPVEHRLLPRAVRLFAAGRVAPPPEGSRRVQITEPDR